jgi:ribosome-associated toxin RatA of RatAB toxin-antitoxin module
MAALAFVTAFAFGLFGAAGPDLPDLSRLSRGEVVVSTDSAGGSHRTVQAAILLDAPAERIWDVMVDCGGAPEFVPGLRECTVVERGEGWEVLQHRVRISSLLPQVTYRFRATYHRPERIGFVRVSGDLKAMEGSWTLVPVEDGRRTVVRYSVGRPSATTFRSFCAPCSAGLKWIQGARHPMADVLPEPALQE